MKFQITIEGDTKDAQSVSVLALLASIAGGTVPNIPTFTGAPDEPDDEPAAVVAGDPNERDSNGLPWDERIHSKARSRNTDLTWRKRKGVNADLVTAVENELRARIAAAPPATPPAVAPVAPPAAPPATPPAAPAVAPVAPPAAPPATPPAAAVAGAPADFGAFMEILSKSMGAGLIDNTGEFVKWLCSTPDVAVNQITDIAADPAKIAAAYNHLVAEKRIAP